MITKEIEDWIEKNNPFSDKSETLAGAIMFKFWNMGAEAMAEYLQSMREEQLYETIEKIIDMWESNKDTLNDDGTVRSKEQIIGHIEFCLENE